MPTYTALTTLLGAEAANLLAEAMERLTPKATGIGVLEVEDGSGIWEVGGYFSEPPDQAGLALLAALYGAKGFLVSELPEVDWVAAVKRELSPVEAGRFFVYGSHDADKVPKGAIPLLIEAAMAFGTGHHGTTLGCLKALDRLISRGKPPSSVVDIGCGTAVLAMAAAKVFDGTILASDIDDVAVDVARANVAANDLIDRVHCLVADGFEHEKLRGGAKFDLIFANILKGPLIDLAPYMASASTSDGFVILSGILNEQADDVIGVYRRVGYNLVNRDEIVEWTTLTLRKQAG